MPRSALAAPGNKVGGSLGHLTVTSAAAERPGLSTAEPGARSGITLFMTVLLSPCSRGLIMSCRTVFEWRIAHSDLSSGVLGFPSLSFSDGVKEQHRSRWHVGVGGCGAFPPVGAVLYAMVGLDAGSVEELPNKLGTVGAVVIQGDERASM
jgi:hypothetical protein